MATSAAGGMSLIIFFCFQLFHCLILYFLLHCYYYCQKNTTRSSSLLSIIYALCIVSAACIPVYTDGIIITCMCGHKSPHFSLFSKINSSFLSFLPSFPTQINKNIKRKRKKRKKKNLFCLLP